MANNKEFDVLISFAGMEREYARAIHDIATANGIKVFLDEEYQHEIWGKNLVEFLDETYRERGHYVLILISTAYCNRAFTRVERRAAFDRMINEQYEFILPVKVDDSWIEGLPQSTAFLDLRTQGVLGICELLVKKLRPGTNKIVIPGHVFIPRIPLGQIPGNLLAKYLLEMCNRQNVLVFGTLIYDEKNIELRKLLTDQIYWDALDKASGPHVEIFAIRDTKKYYTEPYMHMITATSMSRSSERGYYFSQLLKNYFDEEKTTLVYPSILLFIIEDRKVKFCRRIPLRKRNSISDTFDDLLMLFTKIAESIDEADGLDTSADILWKEIKENLINDYTIYIQKPPIDAETAIQKLALYIES